ncbi:mediator of RNA polymerase II transcription subunit 25 isoform X2 [Nasonia vitripennis]|uniref:Mediator of RNA polymerase II transcription subunit 25 n=1 Tax=Nasonia vitripennis TaxID=7425 RepID=A0A7M7H667_NASVI|nr:mediator of RNA polymerase II transcription subunit 25 isoform X2 [Nasonia vitripennis]
MVSGPPEHGMQADVVFVIESTATNGAYLNDFKTNYLVPTLEYFSQGGIEDREFASETSLTLYGIVVYHAADCLPAPFTQAYGPFSNPHKLLLTLEKLEMIGGKGESHANIGEGLATALHCFEDLQGRREPNVATQKHCVLVCNSPPYQIGVQESSKYSGFSVEQLAALFPENNVSLSILSPRKISALFKLFEKAGGDLQSSQTKNYAKDPRHLVLLRNYNLKESPVSPTSAATAAAAAQAAAAAAAAVSGTPSAAQIALSPLQSNDSPNPNQTPQIAQSVTQAQQQQQQQGPPASFRNPTTPQNINSVHQQQQAVNQQQQVQQQQQQPQQNMSAPMGGRPQFNPQISAPPNYHPAAMGARPPHPRGWPPMRPPFSMNPTGPGAGPAAAAPPPPTSSQQSSALIAQLSTPPSALGLNVQPFAQQRMEGAPNTTMAPNSQQAQQQQQQQLNQHQQNQLRMNMQQQQALQQQNAAQQQNAQQVSMGMQQQNAPNQAGPQLNVSGVNQSMASQIPQTVTASQASSAQAASVSAQMTHAQQTGAPGPGGHVNHAGQPMMNGDRTVIWKGMLEWVEKSKQPVDAQKQTWQVPCQVSSGAKDGEPEVKAESWPTKLIMQLMPKMLIGNIGQAYLKNSKSVVFFPSPCEALESLIKVMSNGFAGCVHFTSTPSCNIKVLLLLYTAEKRTFIGFIPNDQQAFVDRLRKVIQQQKSSHAVRGGLVQLRPTGPNPGPGGAGANVMSGGVPSTGISQSGILMSQTNTMTMGGGQITQNVIPNNGLPQQSLAPTTMQQNQINIQAVGLSAAGGGPQGQINSGGGSMIGQQQQQHLEMARQQNLLKIHQLQQTLEAAQQQEAQYKSQEAQYKSQMIQQNLEHAQAQEMQYKQLEAQQAQRGLNAGPVMQAPQPQGNAPRMMRPVMNNALGLRHLLQQQQQPQYRQVLGMQQQMVGPRGQMPPRPMAPTNPQNQQFDEVSNYDFLG